MADVDALFEAIDGAVTRLDDDPDDDNASDDFMTEVREIRDRWAERPLRPLVIIGIGGGLEQWSIVKPGVGMPNTFALDYDREGQSGEEIRDFADEITEAMSHLVAFGDEADDETVANMADSIAEYRRLAASGEAAGRYR